MKIVLILILCVLTTQMSAQNHDFFDDEDTETLDRMDKEDLYTAADKMSDLLEWEYLLLLNKEFPTPKLDYPSKEISRWHSMGKLRNSRKNGVAANYIGSRGLLGQNYTSRSWLMEHHKTITAFDELFYCTTCQALVKVLVRTVRDNALGVRRINSKQMKDDDSFQLNLMSMMRQPRGQGTVDGKSFLIQQIFLDACERLQIQTREVCSGLFFSNWPLLRHIINNTNIDPNAICSLVFQFDFCHVENESKNDWSVEIASMETTSTEMNQMNDGPKDQMPMKTENDLHILHLTDIHYDPWYTPGSSAECNEPLCCQRFNSYDLDYSNGAGFWGDYRDCDLPWHTLVQSLKHIKAQHGSKLDFIIQTGDVIDHMIWETSVSKNKAVYDRVTHKIYELFPDVPVYPCIGNHEPHPLNVFSPPYAPSELNSHWLYEYLYNLWSKWLPEDTRETIIKGGYYTVLAKPGFRIISLNNNDCYTNNWWLFYNSSDSKGQLVWLHDTLLAAEQNGEFVHILAHIPSGDSTCWNVWSREYNRIIERFQGIISGIFNGHSHSDEMHVHYSSKGHAMAVSFNGGSLTPWVYKNPNYRIYRVEPTKMEVVDHETWIFNLTEANLVGSTQSPKWYQEYVFSKEFTDNMSPEGINKLLQRMAEDPNLLRKFWAYKVTMADPELKFGCDQECLEETICRLATTVSNQQKQCESLKNTLSLALLKEKIRFGDNPDYPY